MSMYRGFLVLHVALSLSFPPLVHGFHSCRYPDQKEWLTQNAHTNLYQQRLDSRRLRGIQSYNHHDGSKLLARLEDSTQESSLNNEDTQNLFASRRSFLTTINLVSAISAGELLFGNGNNLLNTNANAAVGTLPEYSTTESILQGVTVRVADLSQQNAMIEFLQNGFSFEVLRKRIRGTVEETWMGFGPEQSSVPDDFTLPVSSFAKYGGHASIHIVYDSKQTTPLYRIGDEAPGNNIAYVQVGVPGYRISQMVAAGGNILDAYAIVDVVSPSGLPIRGVVGIAPDPLMFVAINCENVKESAAYYEQLGFTIQEYPYARPNKGMGQFEPPQPKNSIYMAQSPNSMGVLLLPIQKRRTKIKINPAVSSLNIVYSPDYRNILNSGESDDTMDSPLVVSPLVDPSGVQLRFQRFSEFEKEEKEAR